MAFDPNVSNKLLQDVINIEREIEGTQKLGNSENKELTEKIIGLAKVLSDYPEFRTESEGILKFKDLKEAKEHFSNIKMLISQKNSSSIKQPDQKIASDLKGSRKFEIREALDKALPREMIGLIVEYSKTLPSPTELIAFEKSVNSLKIPDEEKIQMWKNFIGIEMYRSILSREIKIQISQYSDQRKLTDKEEDLIVAHVTESFNDIKLLPDYIKREVVRPYIDLEFEALGGEGHGHPNYFDPHQRRCKDNELIRMRASLGDPYTSKHVVDRAQRFEVWLMDPTNLSKIPKDIVIGGRHRRWQFFPSVLWDLHHLEDLRIEGNNLGIPPEILKLKNLKTISVSSETWIPEVIMKMKHIEILTWTWSNVSLPDDIMEELPKLKKLEVYSNNIQKVPKSIIERIVKGEFEEFFLDISKNPLPPEEIARLEEAIEVGIKANPNMKLKITYEKDGQDKVFDNGIP